MLSCKAVEAESTAARACRVVSGAAHMQHVCNTCDDSYCWLQLTSVLLQLQMRLLVQLLLLLPQTLLLWQRWRRCGGGDGQLQRLLQPLTVCSAVACLSHPQRPR
jgi:hypothetical protein